MSRRDFICPECRKPLGIVRPSTSGGRYLDLLPVVIHVNHMEDRAPRLWWLVCQCGETVEWEGDGVRWDMAA